MSKEATVSIVAIVCIIAAICVIAMSLRKPGSFHPTPSSSTLTSPSVPMSMLAPMGVERLKPMEGSGR